MRDIERILDGLNRAWGGEAWHGPALQQVLSGVTEEEAKARPIPAASTTVEDWTDVTTRSFAASVEELEHAQSRVLDSVARLKDADLDRHVIGQEYTARYMLDGLIHHSTYHAGQIAMLKRAIRG
jgi:uncharacterized damage-inducible protein DinB